MITVELAILFIHNVDIGKTEIYGYAWGVLGFLSGTQISENRPTLAFVFAIGGFICLLIAASKDKD